MTTKELSEKLKACINEYMTFSAVDGSLFGLKLNDGDEGLVVTGNKDDDSFILHIIKIKGVSTNEQKNHKGKSTKKEQKG